MKNEEFRYRRNIFRRYIYFSLFIFNFSFCSYLSNRQATPGNSSPSRNSREAPPPGSDPSAASGGCSEVSEWQRSNFQAISGSLAENLGTATGGTGVLFYLSSKQATPGNSKPSRNSRDAPPPVLMWVILSAKPICSTAAALSPPPMMVTAPLSASA